ncbi:hypothetical protein D3C73_589040 [compost metagenome]
MLCPLLAKHGVTVPIPPVEGMHREEGGEDAESLERGDLILAGGLGMDGDKAAIRLAMLLLAGLNPLDQLIDGRITVDVGEQLPTVALRQFDVVGGLLVAHAGIALVIGLLPGRGNKIGLGQPGGLALRRAIEVELGSRDPEPVLVVAGVVGRGDDIPRNLDIGIGRDIQGQPGFLGQLVHGLDGGGGGAPLLGRGVTEAGIECHACLENRLVLFVVQVGEHRQQGAEEGRLLQYPIGRLAVRFTADLSPFRILAVRPEPGQRQCLAVEGGKVA